MSSDRPAGAPSASARGHAVLVAVSTEAELAELLRSRGTPLLEALEAHLPGSRAHATATGSYAFAASVELGFSRNQCEVARQAAVLHEIGLLYVPAAMLAKIPAERSDAEVFAIENHHEAGCKLARGAGLPENACHWLLRVRERFDGSGPEGIAGEQIPLEARLIRASCVAATLLAHAQGDTARTIATLKQTSGTELDPRLVTALTDVLGRAATA